MSESPVSSCKNCGGKIERIITGGTGLIFKGSGFYLTDYKNEKKSIDDSPNSTKKKSESSKQSEEKMKNISSGNIKTQKKEKKTDE
jgi:predicted nucleic acid-binding Zn ribbon protein